MNWIKDPEHAWLKVKIINIFKANVAYKISHKSFVRKNYAYLEKDRDARIYLKAIKKDPDAIRVAISYKCSRIRSYRQWPVKSVKKLLADICA